MSFTTWKVLVVFGMKMFIARFNLSLKSHFHDLLATV